MAPMTGVQRYAHELVSRLGGSVQAIFPKHPLTGLRGHLWEQAVLPLLARGQLLWSPANVGPVGISRQVLTIHDLASIDHPEWFGRCFAAWYRCLIPSLAHRVIRLITVSEFSKRRLLDLTGLPESRILVIPNGVDNRFYANYANQITHIKQRTGIHPDKYILTVGSLEPRKNLPNLLNAWRLAEERLRDVWLVIVGAEGKKDVFRATNIRSLPPRVLFAGFVADDDLPALYSGAIALAYPSIYEGFGLPALEAMACGTVPIVANSTALPEVVGDAGLLIDPLRTEDLAAAMIRIAEDSDLRHELSRRGIERSREFTWERAASLTWRALTEAAEI
jgi:glycosyltransferase involved in cell wall biosynthesis